MPALHRLAFAGLVRLGRPIGGVRPRRMYHWLARRAFREPEGSAGYAWYRDTWGLEFFLHPYFHLDRQIIAFGSYDHALIEFLRERIETGSVCLDVGANLGQITVHMAERVGPDGAVHAFEPVPHIAARLRTHVERNDFAQRVTVHGVALSDRSGTMQLWGAVTTAENQGMASLAGPGSANDAVVDVATERLDDFVERVGLKRLDWIKVDIQGAEPLFLAGAEGTLERFAPELSLEISPADLARVGSSPPQLVAWLEARGYRGYELDGRRCVRPIEASALDATYSADNVHFTRRPRH